LAAGPACQRRANARLVVAGHDSFRYLHAVKFRAFGLTGGIGTGKSTVAARFRCRGLPVVDGDALARVVAEPGQPALGEIAQTFGAEMLDSSGRLVRARLAEVVFSDPTARARLESIVHPRVRAMARQVMADLEQQGEPLACYEAPLLVEVGLADELRPLVVVSASEPTQLSRVAARDQTSHEKVLARIAAQMPLAAKVAMADYVIDNEGTLFDTWQQVDRVLEGICQSLSVNAQRYPRPDVRHPT
jgi:dephospho-CoA kinase